MRNIAFFYSGKRQSCVFDGRQSFDTLKSYNLERHHEQKHDEISPLLYPGGLANAIATYFVLRQTCGPWIYARLYVRPWKTKRLAMLFLSTLYVFGQKFINFCSKTTLKMSFCYSAVIYAKLKQKYSSILPNKATSEDYNNCGIVFCFCAHSF